MAIHPGDNLAGYRVVRLLGRGGMGEVWGACSEATGREVAIKVLLARAALKPDLVKRFEREARIASAITSPYVCQLIHVDRAADGAHLLVFEHLNGESLADRLKREQYLPFTEVGPMMDDVLQGLVAAHAAGVVHRDLKPGNIFLEELGGEGTPLPSSVPGLTEGALGRGIVLGTPRVGGLEPAAPEGEPLPERRERAKILDFGISKLTRQEKEETTLTAFDATLGSFAYMAPEQVRGAARADERADLYSLGAVTFRALSGRLPFEGATAAMLVSMKLNRAAPSLAEATGEKWPAGIERFLEQSLAKEREQRFASASDALAAWRSIQPTTITLSRRTPARRVGVPRPSSAGREGPKTPGTSGGSAPVAMGPQGAPNPSGERRSTSQRLPPRPESPVPRPVSQRVEAPRHPFSPAAELGPSFQPRAPLASEPFGEEDNPTEVDDLPPVMNEDGSVLAWGETTKRRKNGRP